MALSELDDLLNDLEKTVEEERGLGMVIVYIYTDYLLVLNSNISIIRPYL